jgi:hypothetical protein
LPALGGSAGSKAYGSRHQKMGSELTSEAIELGLSVALGSILEVNRQIGESGRGGRIGASVSHHLDRGPGHIAEALRDVA